ncbi:DUF4230 domain-containing protein [Anaerolineales bacterium HSG24]|nr:DUF4230 domain-containing protein [Anaerolineales bacterium HSG24]
MKNQSLFIALIIGCLITVAVAVGFIGFQAGQYAVQLTPTPTQAIVSEPTLPPPPVIVTNTPTTAPSATPTLGPTNTPTPTPSPTPIVVINKITGLGRLETTEFAMQTVIDLSNKPNNLWEEIVGSDKIVLVAEGEVVAGVDLSKIEPADIEVDGTSVTIILPSTEIFYSRIDNEKTQVYERDAGLLVSPDPNLESRARQIAEEELTKWAIERNIHGRAESSAKLQIENLLLSLGFTNITIEFEEVLP